MDKCDYIDRLSPQNQLTLEDLKKDVCNFSKDEEWSQYFKGCGLYVVGSSLWEEKYNDIDLVLVGLDFRAVFEYDKIFLGDPKTIINRGLVVSIIDADWYPSGNEYTDYIQLEYGGRKYVLNYDNPEIHWETCGVLGDLTTFQRRSISSSKLITELEKEVGVNKERLRRYNFSEVGNPFDPYDFEGISVLTLKINTKIPTDFRIHGENLTREGWKSEQARLNLPYLSLFEWGEAVKSNERPIFTNEDLPEFIDCSGEIHATVHPFLPTGKALRTFNLQETVEDINCQLRNRGLDEL